MRRIRRRAFGGTLSAGSLTAVTGCLGLIGGDEETTASIPTDATFAFDELDDGLRVRYASGPPIVVEALEIRSSGGEAVRWHERGSTNVTGASRRTTGAAATIGASVENWGSEIAESERISVVYVSESAAPTTLATGGPGTDDRSTTTTASATETESGGDGTAATFQDQFEDGSYEDDWRILWLQSGGLNGPQDGESAPLNEWASERR